MTPLAIAAATLVSAAGRGRAATLDALRTRALTLRPCDFDGVTQGWIGRVDGVEAHALPPALGRFDCRNNRLADMALRTDGFAEAVAAARARWGAARIAVVVGTSTSGVQAAELAYRRREPASGALPEDFDYAHTQDLQSLAAFTRAALALEGPAFTVSIACASGARAFLDAARLIASGVADAAIVGGADSLCRMTLLGFASLDLVAPDPCRPFDAERAGISVGEAAAFCLLERATPGETRPCLLGAGAASDGFHMSRPHPEGLGAAAAMAAALRSAGLPPEAIDAINLHGTGTRANDASEDRAVQAVFGTRVPCSATKGWTGHPMGSAGAVEAVLCLICMENDLLPGCLRVTQVDPAFRSDLRLRNEERRLRRMMSNSFGFGGANVSLVLGAPG